MATHSRIPAWRIPWTEEPGGLQSMESGKCQTQPSLNNKQQLGTMRNIPKVLKDSSAFYVVLKILLSVVSPTEGWRKTRDK